MNCVVFVSFDYCIVVHSVVVLWCLQCFVLSGTAIFRSCTVCFVSGTATYYVTVWFNSSFKLRGHSSCVLFVCVVLGVAAVSIVPLDVTVDNSPCRATGNSPTVECTVHHLTPFLFLVRTLRVSTEADTDTTCERLRTNRCC